MFSGSYRDLDPKRIPLRKINSRESGNAWQENKFNEKEVKKK